MSYSLNFSKGVIYGIELGTSIGVIKGDTRSLDYGSDEFVQVGACHQGPKQDL